MDFHGMNRKNLQILCKRHGIPANLKNVEMASRLASLFQKEDEETVTETKISPEEDSVEDDDGIKEEEENLVAGRKAKKVRFSPESDNQVFEFTRSVKKNVRTLRGKHGAGKALQEDGSIELRRSNRSVSKGITVDGSSGDIEAEKGPSNSVKRIGSRGNNQEEEEGKDTDLIAPEVFEDRDVQDGRRSSRLAGGIEKSCVEGEISNKPVALLPVPKRSKQIGSSGSTQEEGKDTDLNAPERVEGNDIQGGRRSRRLAAKTEKSFEEGGTSKSVTLLPAAKLSKRVVDVANKEDEKETGEEQHRKDDDCKVEMVRRRSRRFVNDIDVQANTLDRRRSVRLKASVANPLMGQAKNESVKASRVVKGTLTDKKTDENVVKSKRVTRNMKRDRSAEPGVDSGTASNQSNLTPKKTIDELTHFEQEEACGADVKAGGSSKKSKRILNQECIKDKPQGIIIIEDLLSSSKTKAAESGVIIEKVFDPTLDKSVDSPQRSNIGELNCEPMEGECEEKREQDTVSKPVMEEDKDEVSSRSLSSPTSHIIVEDIASIVIAEQSTKTKDETRICAPESELKENSSIPKLANVEEILENSTECWKEIHSSKDDEKRSFEKDVPAENFHGNLSECNTENESAEEEMEISKVGGMSAGDRVNLTPEKLSGEYSQLEREEVERPKVEARRSSQKMKKTMDQEFVKDKPQGMAEDSPSTSETKATELLEVGCEEKHEQAMTKKDKGQASSLYECLTERSEVKTSPRNCSTGCSLSVETTLPPASVQLPISNPEADLGLPTGDDIVLAVITEEDKITTEETLISTPTSELKEDKSVTKISKVEAILRNSDEEGSLKKDVNFSECNTENSSAEEETETNKFDCMNVNLTPGKLLDAYPQLVPEEAEEPNAKTVSLEFVKRNPQGMAEDFSSTSETKTTEPLMMSENVLDSTSKVSVDISLVNNTQELNSELMEAERGEKQEEDIVLMAATKKDEGEASSLFMQTTPPPSIQIAVSNPESELSVPTAEDIITDKVLKSVQSFVAKFAETDANLENSAECWNESLSSKDDDRGSLEKEKQSAKRHGNFSEYNAENSSAQEQPDICKVGRISDGHCVDRENLDEVKDESLMKSVQTVSSERGCKPNALELSGLFSTEFASHSHKEENVSECLEEEEMKALSQPTPINKAASNELDRSSLFTTPERNLMLMERLSESGKICAADIVTQHSDEAVESVVFTTPEKLLLLGDYGLDDVGMEEEHTTTDFPDDLNTPQNEAFNEADIVVELHDESNIAASPLRQSSVRDFKEERTERNEENRTVELHCESGTCTGLDKHAALLYSASDGAENSGGNKAMEFYEKSVAFTGLKEKHEFFGDSKVKEDEVKKAAQFYEEAGLSTQMHKDLPLADSEPGEAGWLGINNADEPGRLEGQLLYRDSEQKKAVKPAEKAAAEFHDESAISNIPERHPFPKESELEEAAKRDESNALELADCDNFTGANITARSHDMSDVLTASERHTLLKEFDSDEAVRSEEIKAVELQVDSDNFTDANITVPSHDMPDVLTACESHSFMEDFEPNEEENKAVELLGESNVSTNVERHLLSVESFVFISPERRQHLGNSEPYNAGKQEPKEVEYKDESAFFTRQETRLLLEESGQDRFDNGKSGSAKYQSHHASSPKVRESCVAAPDFRESTNADSSGSIASKVSYSHVFSAGEEIAGAEFMPKASHTKNIVGLDAVQRTSKQSRENSPHVDSVNHFDFDTMGADTIMDAERNVSFSSHVLALPAKGNSQTTGEISNPREVARTCSLVFEESGLSTDIQNQTSDAVEELAVTDARVSNNTQNDSGTNGLPAEGDSETIGKISSQLEVTVTCSMVSEKSTPFMDVQNHVNDALEEELAVTDDSEADELIEAKVTKKVDSSGGSDVSGMTGVLAGTEDEQFDTAFVKDISLAPDETTLQRNRNEEAADDKMLKREATPSPAKTWNESSENIGESGTSSEKQVRREPIVIYRTQMKPKRHDMKENAPNSKIVDNLNVTAPRTSKRQPLQDLRKN